MKISKSEFSMAHCISYCSSTDASLSPVCSNSKTSLLNMFSANHPESFYMSVLKISTNFRGLESGNALLPTFKFTKVEPLLECIPGKHRDLFWKIFPNNHFVKSLQIIDKFWLIPLVVFLNMAFNISKGYQWTISSDKTSFILHMNSI